MRKTKIVAAMGVLTVGIAFAVTLWAYPMPGPGQETYVEYYSNASYTTVVGVKAIAHDSACAPYHISWGATSAYSRTIVRNCDVLAAPPRPKLPPAQ